MEKNIAVIKGDGIGPEIVTEAMKVLDAVAKKLNVKKSKIKKHINFYNPILTIKNKKITQKIKNQLIIDIKNLKSFSEFIAHEKPKKESLYGSVDGSKNISIHFYAKKAFFNHLSTNFSIAFFSFLQAK